MQKAMKLLLVKNQIHLRILQFGTTFNKIEDYKNAIVQYKILIDLQNKQLGPKAFNTLTSINNLGLAYYSGDYENAEPLL